MATLNLVTNVLVKGEQQLKSLDRQLGKVDATAGKAGKSFGNMLPPINPLTAAVAGTVALGVAAIGATTAALAEEKGIASLTAAIKANDAANAGNIDKVEETIKARENLAFSDDEQRESLAKLVGVTKDVNKALDLQRTAMDLARLRGIDLSTAGDLIGKVYGGNVGILARYGIQLRKGATAQEALAEIQKRSAGQAEAFADTTSGAVESLGIVFDDLVEDIGKGLLPVLRDVALFLRDDFIPFLRDVAPAIGAIGSAIGSVAGFISDFVNPFGAALDRQKKELEQHQKDEAQRLKAGEDAWLGYQTTITNATDQVVDTVRGLTEAEIATLEDHWDEIRAQGSAMVEQYNVGIFEAQTSLQTEIDALLKVLDERLAPAEEIARLRGQKATLALARGAAEAADDAPAVAAIDQMLGKINAQIAGLGGFNFETVGVKIVNQIVNGMKRQAAVAQANGNLYAVGNLLRDGLEVRSPPKDPSSPLHNITEWGGNYVKTIAAGITSNLSIAENATNRMATAFIPRLSAPVSSPRVSALDMDALHGSDVPWSTARGMTGPTVNINVQGDLKADERTLPGIMVRGLYASGLSQ